MRSGGRAATAFSAASPLPTISRFGVAAPLERVLDQAGDVLLVFDDEDAVFGHAIGSPHVAAGRFAAVSKLLNVGYVERSVACYSADVVSRVRRKEHVRPVARRGCLARRRVFVAGVRRWHSRGRSAQFISLLQQLRATFSKATGSRAANATGGTPSASTTTSSTASAQFEVHLGPRREFAIFTGRPGRAPRPRRARQPAEAVPRRCSKAAAPSSRWEIPSLKLAFTVTLGGGSRTDCESWYILLEAARKDFALDVTSPAVTAGRRCYIDPAILRCG